MGSIGVVGVGNIGAAVARNLVDDGHDVVVADADSERAAGVVGATVGSVADVGRTCSVVLTSLPTTEIVAEVAAAWAATAPAGSILLDLSTSAPDGNRALAERLQGSGHHFVEAPLTGGAVGAEKRALVFMVGGEDEPVERCRPILESLGRAVFHLGPVGTGSTMKLVNSLLAFTCTWVSLEGLSLAAAAGIDLQAAVDVVRTGGATNFYIDRGVDGLDTRGRDPQFALALAAKDARLIDEVAHAAGVPAPVAEAIRSVLTDVVERGLGDRDWSDLAEAAEARSGIPLRLRPQGDG